MLSPEERLERAYRRQIRNLEMEVSFLRDVTWTLTDGKHEIFGADAPRRKEEPVEPMVIDPIVRDLLTE